MPEEPSEEGTAADRPPAAAGAGEPASPPQAESVPGPEGDAAPADEPAEGSEPEPAESATEPPAPAAAAPGGEGMAEAFERRARLAEDRLAEVLAGYRQIKSDNAAHRERVGRTLEQQYQRRRERLLLKFIEILDNLDRALEAAERSPGTEPMLEGLILVRAQLLRVLSDEGLERIPTLGLPFDPQVAEAVGTKPVADPDHHHLVVREELRGYRLKGRIVRASRVYVGVYSEPKPEPVSEEAEDPELGHS